ncbi:MAG: threonine-phosphate decarboxylase [Halomonadaceae bacterium]|nr:MAG: threonine-phosphate decarboxylase [Halomonadaceae bacterium]
MEHGGRLNQAAKRWGIPRRDWLDLSTGINPTPWPVPTVPAECWQRLPEADDALVPEARRWSGAPAAACCLPIAGSQAAISALPGLRKPCRVAVPHPGYAEHGACWQRAGHQLVPYAPEQLDEQLVASVDVLVCINPNNPTGHRFSRESLLSWHRLLAARGGWLLVDEAFIDGTGIPSLAPHTGPEGLLVLRSLGKFFGLAGARAGLLLGPNDLCQQVDDALGPWALSGPGRFVMAAAMADQHWQRQMVPRLQQQSEQLAALLAERGLSCAGGSLLFQYCPHPEAVVIAHGLAAQGVLVRLFQDPPALRFGLPPSPGALSRLGDALTQANHGKGEPASID